jgi:hypothetical protein
MMMRPKHPGTVYLLHFDREYLPGKQHYVGWTSNLRKRVMRHRSGWGGPLTSAAHAQGIGFILVRYWPDGHQGLERSLQGYGPHKACPVCSPELVAVDNWRGGRCVSGCPHTPSC